MAVITPALITSLRTGFSKAFQDSLAATPTDWAKVATRVPSTSASNTYGWLGQFPTLLDALRLCWRLWRKPARYGVLVKVHRGWIEGYCAPVHGGRIFTAPLARDR